MSNLFRSKPSWQVAALLLLVVAVFGPWNYERAYLPPDPEFSCMFPNAQLEGDCGLATPIVLELVIWGAGIPGLLSGELSLNEWNTVFGLWHPLLILPFLLSPVIIIRRERDRRAMLNVLTWALAAAAGGLYLYHAPFRPFPLPWGPLLYTIVSLVALALELLYPMLTTRGERHSSATT